MTTRRSIPDFVWVFLLLTVVLVVMGILSPGTLTVRHVLDLMRQAAPLGVAAAGQTLLLMSGNIDLSVGAQITLCNLVLSTVMAGGKDPGTIFPAVMCAVCLGLLVGVANGYAVANLKIPAFVATLATGLLVQGGYLIFTRGAPSGNIVPQFRVIAEGRMGGLIPWSVVIWAAASGFLSLVVHKSKLGRQMMAVGGNPKASQLSGVSVERTTIAAYAMSSLFAVLSGCLISAYIGLASTGVGEPYTLNSIASSVIGGTPFSGGEGTMAGSFGGALIMTVIQAILTGLNTGDAGKMVSQGLVIIVMVGIYQRKAR